MNARQYWEESIQYLQEHYVQPERLTPELLHLEISDEEAAQTDLAPIRARLDHLLRTLDPHAHLRLTLGGPTRNAPPILRWKEADYLQILIPSLSHQDPEYECQMNLWKEDFAQAFRQPIRRCLVDLRSNTGGSLLGMLEILAPLFYSGDLFCIFDGRGQKIGRVSFNQGKIVFLKQGYPPNQASYPIAILFGSQTASAGELVAMALSRLPQTRSFGSRTRGLISGNQTYSLDQGESTMVFPKCYYGITRPQSRLIPDKRTQKPYPRAERWLERVIQQNPE